MILKVYNHLSVLSSYLLNWALNHLSKYKRKGNTCTFSKSQSTRTICTTFRKSSSFSRNNYLTLGRAFSPLYACYTSSFSYLFPCPLLAFIIRAPARFSRPRLVGFPHPRALQRLYNSGYGYGHIYVVCKFALRNDSDSPALTTRLEF